MVAGVVTVGVVESLEVIDVHHRDTELATQARQRFVERPAAGQLRQPVAIRHHIRRLDDRDDENQTCGSQPDFLAGAGGEPRESGKHGHQSIDISAHGRLRFAEPRHYEQGLDRDERDDCRLLDRRPRREFGRKHVRREVLEGLLRERLCQKDDDDHLHHQQNPAQQARRCYRPALGQQGDEGEIDRQQKHGGVQQHAVAGRGPATEQHIFGQREQRDRENETRAVEAPAKEQGRGKNGKGEDVREAGNGAAQRRQIEE